MNIRLVGLSLRTKKTIEEIRFSESVFFIYGPVGTGKSTVARLVDFCFGGDLERTPAIASEFVSVTLNAMLGTNECAFERSSDDNLMVRVTWVCNNEIESVNAPIQAGSERLLGAEVFGLSDLIFHLCGIEPIKVLKRSRDPDSPTIRLSFRDVWRYCYLDQTHLDSSFFQFEDPYRGRKSQDAMRFFTGLHSERLNQLQTELYRNIDEQSGSREAVKQIRKFMGQFDLGSDAELESRVEEVVEALDEVRSRKAKLEQDRLSEIHPTDSLRDRLRELSSFVSELTEAIAVSENMLAEQEALKAEIITAKLKAERIEQAGRVLEGVEFKNCPQCGSDISNRVRLPNNCSLCGSDTKPEESADSVSFESMRIEFNDRIDQITDSLKRRKSALQKSRRELNNATREKVELDAQLQRELTSYDSAYVESIRSVERELATLEERKRSLLRLLDMPRAISDLEEKAGALQGQIDQLRSKIESERSKLRLADENVSAVSERFLQTMLSVGFPGVSEDDEVDLNTKNWKPAVIHKGQDWGFWDTGSGGKKTLFNVCYALALHAVARERGLPVPNLLIIDSATKNISEDENPELVESLYKEIYRLVAQGSSLTQFVLIDSDLVPPGDDVESFSSRRFAGTEDEPSLIPYYDGP